MRAPHVTRTFGPIHFEDLEPHRFEDLIRELIYDYKDWQSIEATGRSGSDDGIDIRAYERNFTPPSIDDEADDESMPMDGNLWIIQCKRETSVGPTKVKDIVNEIDPKNPPYGYILAASANFSKKAYDVFREELRKKGVMEFHLWGKAELEDMLHMGRYDRILFTFFGISLTTRRKTRATEVRFAVTNKNKLLRTLGEASDINKPVLLRDLNDTFYPNSPENQELQRNPGWIPGIASQYTVTGVLIRIHEYYAYLNNEKKEWDYTTHSDDIFIPGITYDEDDDFDTLKKQNESHRKLLDFFRSFPHRNQAKLEVYGLLKFEDIAYYDDKGDILHNFPHIYVDFSPANGPFKRKFYFLKVGYRHVDVIEEGYTRIKIFPSTFPVASLGKIFYKQTVKVDDSTLSSIKSGHDSMHALFDNDGKYSFLNPQDVIGVATNRTNEELFIKITCKYSYTLNEYITLMNDPFMGEIIANQIGKQLGDNDVLNIYEFVTIQKWEVEEQAGRESEGV